MLARRSEGLVLFLRLAARAKRFALSRHNKHEKHNNSRNPVFALRLSLKSIFL